jgi:hypothetical protein
VKRFDYCLPTDEGLQMVVTRQLLALQVRTSEEPEIGSFDYKRIIKPAIED